MTLFSLNELVLNRFVFWYVSLTSILSLVPPGTGVICDAVFTIEINITLNSTNVFT